MPTKYGRREMIGILASVACGWPALALAHSKDNHKRRYHQTAAAAGGAPGGPITLVDQSNRTVTDKDYLGKFMLVFFGYTGCADICPTTLLDIGNVMETLGEMAAQVQPVFISLDPERDTPEVLTTYLTAFDPRITGLTGTLKQVRQAASAYKVFFEKVESEKGHYSIDHSGYIYLMGTKGEYLAHFAHGTPPESMAREILKMVRS